MALCTFLTLTLEAAPSARARAASPGEQMEQQHCQIFKVGILRKLVDLDQFEFVSIGEVISKKPQMFSSLGLELEMCI